jgi:hypothetical protein
MPMTCTPAQLASVRALVEEETQKAAAHRLGISLPSQRDRCTRARLRLGAVTTYQLIYALAVAGELVVALPPVPVPVRRPNGGYHGPRSPRRR